MDPEMFILTAAGISLNFAVAKTIAASGMGLMAGCGNQIGSAASSRKLVVLAGFSASG
jgi:hypothetical protein